jgi:endogenous inhibitor of DNA gyrase (YacG/DUF329 family)
MSQNDPIPNPRPRRVGSDGTVFRCPQCKAVVRPDAATFFPFCSERCKLLDLGNWLDGGYSVSRPIDPSNEEDDQLPRIRPTTRPPADEDEQR